MQTARICSSWYLLKAVVVYIVVINFSTGSSYHYSHDPYRVPASYRRTGIIDNVVCTGSEPVLIDCEHYTHALNVYRSVEVTCQSRKQPTNMIVYLNFLSTLNAGTDIIII